MKQASLLLLFTIIAGCNSSKASMAYPIVVVDEEHNGFSRPDGSDPPAYEVPAAAGLVLDTSNYQVQVPPDYKVDGPNMIHLLMGKDKQYRAPWKTGALTHVLTAKTLTARPGSTGFTGLGTGETAIVAIGFDHTGITPGKENTLSVMWLGLLKVK